MMYREIVHEGDWRPATGNSGWALMTAAKISPRSLTFLLFVAAMMLLDPALSVASSPLDTLVRQHPRLFIHDSDLPAIHVRPSD
jgi:hypothetical protein